MSNGLHLELDKKQIAGSSFSQGVLTLEKAGDFTVQIKEYLELLDRKSKLDLTKGRTLVDSSVEKDKEDIKTLLAKFNIANWVWNTVYHSGNTTYTQNLFVEKGFPDGKIFSFPEVLEGGGYCYVEAFFDGESPMGKRPNGLFVRALGTPKIIRVEWTDMQYNPIKDTKVAFGSHLLLHIYTQGLYGQDILVGLKDVNGLNKDLNIANSNFFEREVKTYPVKPFEENHPGVSGLLIKSDNPKQAESTIQKAVIEIGVDFSWRLGQLLDIAGSFGDELKIETQVIQKTTGEEIKMEEDSAILHVSFGNGEKKDYDKDTTNKPVVVGEIDTTLKVKESLNFTFGVFIDGTLNNMYNTEMKQKMDSIISPKTQKAPQNTAGVGNITLDEMKEVYGDFGDPHYSESSYENDLSNPAILFKNYEKKEKEYQFRIYTEGIGTHSAPTQQGGTLTKEDYKKDDMMQAPAFGAGDAGIRDKVRKSIVDVVDQIRKVMGRNRDSSVGTITFDVFGFSRGAAAARHFTHVVTHPPYAAKTGWLLNFQKVRLWTTYDLQYTPVPEYDGKVMPEFGVLGQLLQEAELLDPQTRVNVRFVGIYDTVPHHGGSQSNDVRDLGLDDVNKANYVVHMVAEDEYRANFDLVDISSVAKVSADSGKEGGTELTYPGVHCDVGGAYSEGGGNRCYRLKKSDDYEELEKEKEEFAKQGWYKEKELNIKVYHRRKKLRLEGYKEKVSNQYSYIPLHIMSGFCQKREVPINEGTLIEFKDFKNNWIDDNKKFLQKIKNTLWEQSFNGGQPIRFMENGKVNEDLRKLRYHYLHWNSTYGDPREAFGTWTSGKNHPNLDENGKRKRNVH